MLVGSKQQAAGNRKPTGAASLRCSAPKVTNFSADLIAQKLFKRLKSGAKSFLPELGQHPAASNRGEIHDTAPNPRVSPYMSYPGSLSKSLLPPAVGRTWVLGRVPRWAGRWRQPVRGTQSTRRGWQGLLGRGFPSPSRNRTERQRKVCSGLWPSSQTPPKTQAGSGVSAPEGKASANPKKKKRGEEKK